MRSLSPLPRIALVALAVPLVAVPLLASSAPDISGDWVRSDGTARVHIASCGTQFCAINTWIKDQSRGEQVGDRLIMTLEPQGASALVGAAFDVRRRLSYSLQISVDRNSMQTHGCVIKGIVCRTMSWTRAQ
jgi:uncharacterized protein (DUF2147 family)